MTYCNKLAGKDCEEGIPRRECSDDKGSVCFLQGEETLAKLNQGRHRLLSRSCVQYRVDVDRCLLVGNATPAVFCPFSGVRHHDGPHLFGQTGIGCRAKGNDDRLERDGRRCYGSTFKYNAEGSAAACHSLDR